MVAQGERCQPTDDDGVCGQGPQHRRGHAGVSRRGLPVSGHGSEGTEICDWLNSRGITCMLLKYRVPDSGPTMKNGHAYYPKVQTAVQDAQRTLGLVRQHSTRTRSA